MINNVNKNEQKDNENALMSNAEKQFDKYITQKIRDNKEIVQ